MKKILQFLVLVYRKTLSPFIGNQCRFTPSCSCYMHEALEKHGALKGTILGVWRILRCNPFHKASWVDPVPEGFPFFNFLGRFAPTNLFRYKTHKD